MRRCNSPSARPRSSLSPDTFTAKRRETIATPENEVLRAFAELTLREAKAWIEKHPGGERRTRIEAHGMRAKRLATMLRTHGVAEARAPVIPNFPLRFDPRYHEIWIAWNELRRRARAKERDWMWQTRTWMELAGARAAMHLRQRVRTERGGGILTHAEVKGSRHGPRQGRYLEGGLKLRLAWSKGTRLKIVSYDSTNQHRPAGSAAKAEDRVVWYQTNGPAAEVRRIGELPWNGGGAWEPNIERWSDQVIG